MDRYYCVFKLSNYMPQRQSFEATSPATAISKMMELANVTSTADIEEAEILKYVGRSDEGKPVYIKVFTKFKQEEKGRVVLQHKPPVSSPPVPEAKPDVYKKPYAIEVL